MIYLIISFIIILFISIIIDVILYNYDINYRVYKVLQYIIDVSVIVITIGSLIACLSSINDNTHESIRNIPIVTPIVLPIR